MTYRKKLIEVALPLEAINMESAREKSIRHGHPSTLHLWWARRPLAACRAVLFASLVDDPSSWPDKFPTEEAQNAERQRLFDILGRITIETNKKGITKQVVRGLVSWDDINDPNSGVLIAAQREIARSIAWNRGDKPPTEPEAVRRYLAGNAPPVYDPFAGGGSIPLEAQRLGLEAHASDLNPVAVLINKALIEIPPKFKDMSPVNPEARQKLKVNQWKGAQGLAEDVRYYGKWMRDEAEKRIGHLYPKVKLPQEYGEGEATVIAWLWTRTAKCPNPACGCQMPLVRSLNLSTQKGKETRLHPTVVHSQNPPSILFGVEKGKEEILTNKSNRQGVTCICCGTPASFEYLRVEGKAGRMSTQMMAIVADIGKGRVYLPADKIQEEIAHTAKPKWQPDELVTTPSHDVDRLPMYGMRSWGDAFTARQLVALTTLNDLVDEVEAKIHRETIIAGVHDSEIPIHKGASNAKVYADAVATYLALAVSRTTNTICSLAIWSQSRDQSVNVFSRQALAMNWDFPEVNPFARAAGDFGQTTESMSKTIASAPASVAATVLQRDAATEDIPLSCALIATDPPYFDNVGYADLSDFFYVWLRRSLNTLYPSIFGTLLTPKFQELVASHHRFDGNRKKAQEFFEQGLTRAFERMYKASHPNYPLSVYYAFKQTESENQTITSDNLPAVASTGWETMLEGLLQSGFSINGTWPMRTERPTGVKVATNALASSIVLVCRPRPENAPQATRRQLLNELQRELPDAIKKLQQGNIAPVDLAQASIGPGMAIYSRYAKVLEADGSPMRVRTALQLINQTLDQFLSEQEGEFDGDSRWAIAWFEQHQFNDGLYGDAETLSKAKNTAVQGMVNAGILIAKGGKVRLLRRDELPDNWNPADDDRVPDWEATQHLIRTLDQQGETGAANLLMKLGDKGEVARDLAYRLYSICDRKNWTQEAMAYNSLVISYPEISRLASEHMQSAPTQGNLF
ncbi:DUF1156 domain-containing protein [Phormidium sp. FACHB-592]|uniref:DUF1156 domain-containing protein n=1 Tax=Stenomitos frigidus AS-A4 TaxID=2933935 RepID=A0ABV0KPW7_9CYAN|nr:DUF1156 domain-containing protein [Phormidium sp. FACHB-592]MBD2075495.1 DUF1156 domain-containing protein [Phormidium sp. FACHB-592]